VILAGPADQSQRRSSRRKAASCFVALPELFEGQHAKKHGKKHGKTIFDVQKRVKSHGFLKMFPSIH